MLETNDNWCVNIDRGLLNGVIFIDLKNAFDAIDHEIILKKLTKDGVDQDALKWFKSYLTNRMQRCNVNVVVNFLSQLIFIFLLFWGIVMYANEFETKEKQKLTKIKN